MCLFPSPCCKNFFCCPLRKFLFPPSHKQLSLPLLFLITYIFSTPAVTENDTFIAMEMLLGEGEGNKIKTLRSHIILTANHGPLVLDLPPLRISVAAQAGILKGNWVRGELIKQPWRCETQGRDLLSCIVGK